MSTFKFPDILSPENLELKGAIIKCNKKAVFRTDLIQSYINEDWENFAQKYAYADFFFYLSFVILIIIQFW